MLMIGTQAAADGTIVDKVYDPYVTALEREIEYRFIAQNDARDALDDLQIHRLGLKKSWSDRWYTELYLIGEKDRDSDLSLDAYELEVKLQLTEQGEYWADWGLLFELETERDANISEFATSLLVAREWGRLVTTANLGLIYEWGDDIASEWETGLRFQARYRLRRHFEPALELYAGQDVKALGPAFVGDVRAGGRKNLHWEIGVVFGIDRDSPDQTFRGMLEFEF
jgi:hypothetical protein